MAVEVGKRVWSESWLPLTDSLLPHLGVAEAADAKVSVKRLNLLLLHGLLKTFLTRPFTTLIIINSSKTTPEIVLYFSLKCRG